MSGWTGMDEAIRDLEQADPARAVELALGDAAEAAVVDIVQRWPVDTGASRDAWRAEGTEVRNDRREVSHIRNGLVERLVPPILEEQADVVDEALQRHMGLD